MSHLACGDDPANAMNAPQLSRFRQALAMLPPAPASLAASHGVMLGAEYHFDLVRPGRGALRRQSASPRRHRQSRQPNLMQTAAVLTARVLQLRRIDSGESVGYGATFRAKRPTMLATVALGYADGFPRTLSNKGVAVLERRAGADCGPRLDGPADPGCDRPGRRRRDVGDEAELLGDISPWARLPPWPAPTNMKSSPGCAGCRSITTERRRRAVSDAKELERINEFFCEHRPRRS